MESTDMTLTLERTALVVRAAAFDHNVLRAMVVTDDEQYREAATFLQGIKHEQKMLDELEEREKRPHLDALGKIREEYGPLRAQFDEAEEIIKTLLVGFTERIAREREAEQARLNIEAEATRQRLEKRADKALANGKIEQAMALHGQANAAVAPVLHHEPPKVEGLHYVESYDFEIINKADVPEEYKIVDLKLLRRVVSALKGASRITGVRIFKVTRAVSRSQEQS
jgi:hypothetical protein